MILVEQPTTTVHAAAVGVHPADDPLRDRVYCGGVHPLLALDVVTSVIARNETDQQ